MERVCSGQAQSQLALEGETTTGSYIVRTRNFGNAFLLWSWEDEVFTGVDIYRGIYIFFQNEFHMRINLWDGCLWKWLPHLDAFRYIHDSINMSTYPEANEKLSKHLGCPQPWHHFKVFLLDFPRLFSNLPRAALLGFQGPLGTSGIPVRRDPQP